MAGVDRRDFLKLGISFGALPILIATGSTQTFGTGKASNTRPFEMLVLGDSVMWGQGLEEANKAYTRVREWLQTEVFKKKRIVNTPVVQAHSGATIFPSIENNRTFTTRNKYGETNRGNPSILYQIENAIDDYQSRGLDLKLVDLILLDGGINDFNAMKMLEPKLTESEVDVYARDYCRFGIMTALRVIRGTFPNATVVVCGYYPIISKLSKPDLLFRPPFALIGVETLTKRSLWWRDKTNSYLAEAVEKVNRDLPTSTDRILFAPVDFRDENAYGAGAKSYLWRVGEDQLYDKREKWCREDGKSFGETSICKRAGTFHPNVLGANAYAEAIKSVLTPVLSKTGWLAD